MELMSRDPPDAIAGMIKTKAKVMNQPVIRDIVRPEINIEMVTIKVANF
jgi:hypothetical protein